jgi:hypothetical protein
VDSPDQKKHLDVQIFCKREDYTFRKRKIKTPPWPKISSRAKHGTNLQTSLQNATRDAKKLSRFKLVGYDVTSVGFFVCIRCIRHPDFKLSSLEDKNNDIELLSVTDISEEWQEARLFFPLEAKNILAKKIDEYLDMSMDTEKGNPKNKKLVEGIKSFKIGKLSQIWNDPEELPKGRSKVWWEVWIISSCYAEIEAAVGQLNLKRGVESTFSDRTIFNLFATKDHLKILCLGVGGVAELRRPTTVSSFFLKDFTQTEHQELAKDLVDRTTIPGADAPHVCILDTGVNRGHRLLEPFLKEDDLHSCCSSHDWPKSDNLDHLRPHGTEMSGLVLFGDLFLPLESIEPYPLKHRLESVRILPSNRKNDEKDYGPITEYAVSIVEDEAPPLERKRSFCMAITGKSGRETGEPTPWSATVDYLSYPHDDELNPGRLFIISAGNVDDYSPIPDYLDRNETSAIEDPAQAWNAITVGAMTYKDKIVDRALAGYSPVAEYGCISPSSCISLLWDESWPLKPEIVMEGGNRAESPDGAIWDTLDDLQLLTTSPKITTEAYTTFGDTSAATALAARLVAQIQAAYPKYLPETIRALVVHSARWTKAMQKKIDSLRNNKTKTRNLVRIFGFGVPDLDRAIWSAKNRLNLIVEDKITPFHKGNTMKDMRLYQLPWPEEALRSIPGEVNVRLRVTLPG